MNPYLELRRLLQRQAASVTGSVVSVSGQALKVRTAQGVIDARSVDATAYNAGDEVMLRDGVVRGKVKPINSVPVYYV